MDGLIIKEKWLNLILNKEKIYEIRGCQTKKINEKIYLLESGTQKIKGTCIITNVYKITEDFWEKEKINHKVNISYNELIKIYPHPYAWELSYVEPLPEKFYQHPKGAVIWVKDVDTKQVERARD